MVASAKPNPFDHLDNHAPAARDVASPRRLAQLVSGMTVLVVDPDPSAATLVAKAIGGAEARAPVRKSPKARAATARAKPRVFRAADLAEATQAMKQIAGRGDAIDLVVADASQSSCDAAALLAAAAQWQPEAGVVVTAAQPTLAAALDALRRGALDYLPKPLAAAQLADSLKRAAGRRFVQVRDRRRLGRLKSAVRQLNQARRTVSKKVDLLCGDLVNAYSDVARQVEQVRVGEHLRRLLGSAADLEQMLCHLMDWVLRELGHCNIAVYLTDENGKPELGAYMKHTVSGDAPVTDWLARHVVPRVGAADAGLFHGGSEVFGRNLTGADAADGAAALIGQTLIGVDCAYLAESLGTILVFRKADKPFGPAELELLRAAGPIFALTLTQLVRGTSGGTGGAGQDEPKRRREKDDQDWWKRGEAPPF